MYDWSVRKCLAVGAMWTLGISAAVIPIAIATATATATATASEIANTNADRHREHTRQIELEQERACLAHPGYQWIDDNCVRTAP